MVERSLFKLKFRGNIHTSFHGASHRAEISMKTQHFFGGLTFIIVGLQMIGHMNATNDQYLTIFLNLTPYFRVKLAITGWNFARFQRATKGSG